MTLQELSTKKGVNFDPQLPQLLLDSSDKRSDPMPEFLPSQPRIALYSHDTLGLGHIRRNLLIAETLVRSSLNPAILLLTGAREAGAFPPPDGADYFVLPGVAKQNDGRYQSRGLNLPLNDLIRIRSKAIESVLAAFRPDLFIVDKVPLGAFKELGPSLQMLRHNGHTRCVLGLRDVLDDPKIVAREWREMEGEASVRDYYDNVWIYGDAAIYDLVEEYSFSEEIARKVQWTGYLVPRRVSGKNRSLDCELQSTLAGLLPGKLAVCLVGGGQDGFQLAQSFVRAELPPNFNGIVVTGPFMPAADRKNLDRQILDRSRVRVLNFLKKPETLVQLADCVVAMGGYNTTCELLAYQKRALLVPRINPRREQWIRATRLAAHGLVDMIHPEQVSPVNLARWIGEDSPTWTARSSLSAIMDIKGLARVSALASELSPRAQGNVGSLLR